MCSNIENEIEMLSEDPFTFLTYDIKSIKHHSRNVTKKTKIGNKSKSRTKKLGTNNLTQTSTFLLDVNTTGQQSDFTRMSSNKKLNSSKNTENMSYNTYLPGKQFSNTYIDKELNDFKQSLKKDKKGLLMS